ncbi:hypothetical protein ACFLSI_03955 [Bacteroidota bacterium]
MEKAHYIIRSSFIVFDNNGMPTINKMMLTFYLMFTLMLDTIMVKKCAKDCNTIL